MFRKILVVALTGTIVAFFSFIGTGCAKKPKPPEVTEKSAPAPAATAKPVKEGEKPFEGFKPIAEPAPQAPQAVPGWVHLEDIHFDFDKADIKGSDKTNLQETARILKENPSFNIALEGHCDERGTNSYNRALGDKRASSVEGYLSTLGVAKSRMTKVSYGEEKPVCSEHNEGCWSKNRRVHFLVSIGGN